jgi:hypothetical protein
VSSTAAVSVRLMNVESGHGHVARHGESGAPAIPNAGVPFTVEFDV